MSNDPEFDARVRAAWQRTADRWDTETLTLRPEGGESLMSDDTVAEQAERIIEDFIAGEVGYLHPGMGEQAERLRTKLATAGLLADPADRDELEAWRSGRRRKSWPKIDSVPDGLHYAAELARAQGTEGGNAHDDLLREAAARLKELNDIAPVLLAEKERAEAEVAELRQKLSDCELLLTDLGKTHTRVSGERDELRATVERLGTQLATMDSYRADVEMSLHAGELSDGFHTHNELYEQRMLYNAALFNTWDVMNGYNSLVQDPGPDAPRVVKSWNHSDGQQCFGGGWFIVVAELPTGQISNHYEAKHWDLFTIPKVDLPPEYDGHTPQEAADRLRAYLRQI